MSSLCSFAPFESTKQAKQAKQASSSSSNQQGGGSSDYYGAFYARNISVPELTKTTLENIDNSPMFNPLAENTVIPTVLTGIVPVASVLANSN
jgi:hypothetical protein